MSKKKYKIKWGRFSIFLLLIAALVFAAIKFVPDLFKKPCEHVHGADGYCTLCGEEYPHEYNEGYCTLCGSVDPDFVFPDEIIDFSVLCAGDVMAHGANINSAYNNDGSYFYESSYQCYTTDGSFDFTEDYTYVKEYIEKADLALVNLETTFSGGQEYSGYWGGFSAPDSLADALKYAGFDVVFTCNNHSLDYGGVTGLRRTVGVLRDRGLVPVGSRAETNENRSVITEANGVKVGVVAYTYETGVYGDYRSLNGAYMAADAPDYLNGYRPDAGGWYGVVCDEDKAAIKEQIDWCKNNGAEVVIAYFHWDMNNEYVFEETPLEKDLARFSAECGADIVFGSHPHRVQSMEILDVNGRQVPVYYSLGNYISNQRYETMDNTPADDPFAGEEEIMAYLDVSYNRTQKTVSFDKVSAIPVYVDKFYTDEIEYRIYPVIGDIYAYPELGISGNYDRAQRALSTITGIVGEKYIY